jgi:hypothetical protein
MASLCSASLHSSLSFASPTIRFRRRVLVPAVLSVSIAVFAQDSPAANQQSSAANADTQKMTVTVPAGTRLALVLTYPVQSRTMHRGDDIYAQILAPVDSGNELVIPPGTFVQGSLDKLGRNGGRGELRLQSMAITFLDGYVASVAGPITLRTNEGYALKDPGNRRAAGALAMLGGGGGLGALIGHSVGKADSSVTTPFPPGCVGGPPFCTTTTTPVFGTKTKDAIIGAGIGSGIGAAASVVLLFGSRHFFIDVGAPVEMTLEAPLSLDRKEVDAAIKRSAEQPVALQPTVPRPMPPPMQQSTSVNHGTCYTPGTPGTAPTVIPGAPGANGVPGPPTVVPGTPPTPGTPYPCP